MKPTIFGAGDGFYRVDRLALSFDGQHGTRVHDFAVQKHGAGTTLRPITNSLCPGDSQTVAHGIEKGYARLQLQSVLLPINRERDRSFARAVDFDRNTCSM